MLAAVAIGVLTLVLLAPASGIDKNPPECYSAFGYVVPCGNGLALGIALGCAAVVGAGAHLLVRRTGRPEQ